MTHIETFSLWSFENGDKIKSFGDVRKAVPGMEIDYLIDCMYDPEGRLYLSCGSYSGHVGLVHVILNGFEPLLHLNGGHEETVRASYWDTSRGVFLTGDEQGVLSLWSL